MDPSIIILDKIRHEQGWVLKWLVSYHTFLWASFTQIIDHSLHSALDWIKPQSIAIAMNLYTHTTTERGLVVRLTCRYSYPTRLGSQW